MHPSGFQNVASTRRLAAIMFTDIVGYTTLAQADEAAALKLLQEQQELVHPLFVAHHGREVKSTGDGSLVEFDSALRAVQCAIDIQEHLQERNSQPVVSPLQLRIGVHLGDIEERSGDIFGDSVNVASRIQPLAEPGGICISEPVFGQVRNKIPNQLEKLGPRVLKGLLFPIEIYRVKLSWAAKAPAPATSGPTRLAVLPFANISPDPKDAYFADGLTEEMITVLSQLRELRVIARTSVMPYKSTSEGVAQIGAELGVEAVLEGSVRKSGEELRIDVQLIDVDTQEHTWAHTYDRKLGDVFALQTEIAKRVAKQLKVNMKPTEETRLEARHPVRSDSYLAYLKGRTFLHDPGRASIEAAKDQFELAISLDPENAGAYSGIVEVTGLLEGWYAVAPPTGWEQTSRRLASRAVELDPNLADAHTSWALILWSDFEYAAAERELKVALSLNPSYSPAHLYYAGLLQDEARVDEALVEFALAEAADPLFSNGVGLWSDLLIWLGRLDEALVKIRRFAELVGGSGPWVHYRLARYYLARSERERCLEEFHQAEEQESDPRWKRVWRAWYYALSEEKEQARALLRQEEALPEYFLMTHLLAVIHAELGDLDECFRLIEKGAAFQQIRLDPRLEGVRNDPRFQVLLKKRNLA
jgi:adenylate cyclase